MVHLTKDLPEPFKYAHPICVAKKLREMGYDPATAPYEARLKAAEKCLEEGKVHGIAKLFHPEKVRMAIEEARREELWMKYKR